MAFSNFAYLTEATPGAPPNRGVNGDLNALLHWALTVKSNWVRLYDDPVDFYSVWQPALGGPVLTCHHESTQSGRAWFAIVRGAESASSPTAYVNPFPSISQVGDTEANWITSSNTGARPFRIVVWETGIVYASNFSDGPDGIIVEDVWDVEYFAKCPTRFAGDTDGWACSTRKSTLFGPYNSNLVNYICAWPTTYSPPVYSKRSATGTIISEMTSITAPGYNRYVGAFTGFPAMGAGIGGAIDRKLLTLTGLGGTSGLGPQPSFERMVVPHLWVPLHSSSAGFDSSTIITEGTTEFFLAKEAGRNSSLLIQTTNDWSGSPYV